jgi:hypothetical protein
MADDTVLTLDSSAGPGRDSAEQQPAAAAVPVTGSREECLAAALGRVAPVRGEPSSGRWQIRIPGTRRIATIELRVDWLTFDAPLRALRSRMDVGRIGPLLHENSTIPGCLRIVGDGPGDGLGPHRHLVSEIPAELLPWGNDAALETLFAATIGSLAAHLRGDRRAARAADKSASSRPTPEQLKDMLEEAGWPAQSDDGRLDIPLEVPGDYVVAGVHCEDGLTRLRLPIVESELRTAPDDCRRAVTVFLWLAASRVRMVRALRSRRLLAIEACLPAVAVSDTVLQHACAALSTAAQLLLPEARLLAANEQLARTYLWNLGLAAA